MPTTKARAALSYPLRLYRRILRVHRWLPRDLRSLGDQYVRSEFRMHRTVSDPATIQRFMHQWEAYTEQLEDQVEGIQKGVQLDGEGASSRNRAFGSKLDPKMLDRMTDDQIQTLWELRKEAQQNKEG